jgi:hypothetical protein
MKKSLYSHLLIIALFVSNSCALFKENDLDPNSDLSLLLGLQQFLQLEDTITRMELKILDSGLNTFPNGVTLRSITPGYSASVNSDVSTGNVILEFPILGKFDFEVLDRSQEIVVGSITLNILRFQEENTFAPESVTGNLSVPVLDFFQGFRSEIGPFVTLTFIRNIDKVPYFFGRVPDRNDQTKIQSYLIRGGNPSRWEISLLTGIPRTENSSNPSCSYNPSLHPFSNEIFIGLDKSCSLPGSEENYFQHIPRTGNLPISLPMRKANLPSGCSVINFQNSLRLNNQLQYYCANSNAYFLSADRYKQNSPDSDNVLGLAPTCNPLNFGTQPIYFSSQNFLCEFDTARYVVGFLETGLALNATDPNLELSSSFTSPSALVGWVVFNRNFFLIRENANNSLLIFQGTNTITGSTGPSYPDIEIPNTGRVTIPNVLPGAGLGFVLQPQPLSFGLGRMGYTLLGDLGGGIWSTGVLSSFDSGTSWRYAVAPDVNRGSFNIYNAYVRETGEISLIRNSTLGVRIYQTEDGQSYQRSKERFRAIPSL